MPVSPRGYEQPFDVAPTPGINLDYTEDDFDPSAWQVLGAAARQSNTGVSYYNSKLNGISLTEPEAEFDGATMWEGIVGTKYESRWDRFTGLRNRKAFEAMKSQIDMEDDDQRTLRASPTLGTLFSIGASLFDLPTVLPGGAIVRTARTGVAIGRTALAGAAAGVLDAGVSELALQSSQQTRTPEESLASVGSGALFGALLGTAAGAVMNGVERREAVRLMDEAKAKPAFNDEAYEEFRQGAQSGGAAAVPRETDIAGFDILGKPARAVGAAMANLNPVLRAAHSPSLAYREVMANLQETGFALARNARGAGDAAVESAMKYWDRGALATAIQRHTDLYSEARRAGVDMSRSEFSSAVGRAMRRMDVGDNDFVTKSAQSWRKVLIDPLKDEAIATRLFPEDVKVSTAPSYFSRVYRTKLIAAEEGEFKAITRKWLDGQLQAVEEAAARGAAKGDKPDLPAFVSRGDREDYINSVADEIFDKITGRLSAAQPSYRITSNERGPLKERTFSIPDALIERYLEDDVEMIGRRYARIMSSDVELARKFGRPDMDDQIKAVRDDYNKLRERAKTPKERLALKAREESDIADLKGVRDLLRGQYRVENQHEIMQRGLRAVMTFNYLRSMGGVLFANLTELLRPAMVHGLGRFLGQGLAPFVTNLKAAKLSVRDAKLLGGVTERVLLSRLSDMAELADPYASSSPFERLLDNMSSVFTRATLLPFLNDFNRSVSAVLTQNRILENAGKKYGSLSERERTYMGFLGIDPAMAQRIDAMYREFGSQDGNVRVANIEDWTDAAARRAYAAAVNKDLDSTIVVKGAGDVPLRLQTPIGKALTQFKSYAMASNQRVLMRGLQDGPASLVTGMTAMGAIGVLVYALKQIESGNDISTNPGTLIAEGLDRTGIFSLAFEVNNAVEKTGAAGIYSLAAMPFGGDSGARTASRFASRNAVDSFAGPTFGLLKDLASVISMAAPLTKGEEPDLTPGDITTARRLTPFASLPYWRWLIDQMVVPDMKQAVE